MSDNQLPVLTLDIDEAKIRQLHEISEKFKLAFSVGPGGFPAKVPRTPIPGTDPPANKPGGEQASSFDKFLRNLNKQAKETQKTFGLINKMLGATTGILKGLFTTTLSWGSKLIALSVAGPFGFGLMANRAASGLKDSQALNMTTGQKQAARNVFGARFSSTDSVLQTLANAQNNHTSQEYAALRSLGLNPDDDPAKNLPKYFAAVDKARKQWGGNALPALQGMGVNITAGDLNQVAANSDQIPLLTQQYSEQSQRFDNRLSPETQRGYQDAFTKLSDNATSLSNTFLTAVSKLGPSITKFSDSITSGLDKFISGKNGQAVFEMIAGGLNKISDWLASPTFQADMEHFTTLIGDIVKALGSAIERIHAWITDPKKAAAEAKKKSSFENAVPVTRMTPAVPAREGESDGSLWGGVKAAGQTVGGLFGVVGNSIFSDAVSRKDEYVKKLQDEKESYGPAPFVFGTAPKTVYEQMAVEAAKKHGLPAEAFSALIKHESRFDPRAYSKAGAMGLGQLMPETAKGYGLSSSDVWDPKKNLDVSALYISDNLKRYKGDWAKTLAQYNGGNAAVDKNGDLSVKMETVKYLISLLPKEGLNQHPGIMTQLVNAREQLSNSPNNARATIHLEIDQKPGSNFEAQVKGMNLVTG